MQIALKYIKERYPSKYTNSNVKAYYKIKNGLHINDGLPFIDEKLLVSTTGISSSRKYMLQIIHEAHLG